MILACRACGLWEHKYRAGCTGHDQSIRAGKSEWSTDIIKRQTLGLQWSRYGLQNGGDTGCTTEHVHVSVSERQDHIGCRLMMDHADDKANRCISVHALMGTGQDVCT